MIVRIEDAEGIGYLDRIIHVTFVNSIVTLSQFVPGNDSPVLVREINQGEVEVYTDSGETLRKFTLAPRGG